MIRSHHRALAGLDRDLGGTLRVVWYVDYSTSSLKADRSVYSYGRLSDIVCCCMRIQYIQYH